MSRDQAFGYRCHGCGHCCRHVLVRVNGYEIDRLAANRGLAAEALVRAHTVVRGGVRVLRQDAASGDCTFRSDAGCAVYPDRPLACRLYPLKREAGDQWRIPPPDPASAGAYTGEGTVGDFLERQGVDTFLEAAGYSAMSSVCSVCSTTPDT